ncbi:ESX secretion-associated protein EspG [Saccharopolyspora erythraea]|uniref:ESX secretion-associated protein EspG n=1 Tax=Saccharopolyspora erythraea TaxID=1836 RepID=UPI001BADB4F2|nr:ESX secretion-associated protein EspG [Saccharopolyspora erythraea]QUH03516.1 ESX secretion-associated protein EspG [Saccharopolyspora erythraea]
MTAATATEAGTLRFGLVELDLLATHAGAALPFPLRVPSFGRIAGEREVLLAAAGQTLRWRGLADDAGPVGPAAELVTALREHRSTVDLVLGTPDGPVGVAVVVYRSWALICRQAPDDDPASTVGIRRVPQAALARELLALVPDLAPARAMPITLPARAVNGAARVLEGVEDDAEKALRLRELVRDCGGDPGLLDQLAGLLPELNGWGQLGATARTRSGAVRAGTELSWLDGPRGRLRVNRAGDGWVSVNPLRQADLRGVVEVLGATARVPR